MLRPFFEIPRYLEPWKASECTLLVKVELLGVLLKDLITIRQSCRECLGMKRGGASFAAKTERTIDLLMSVRINIFRSFIRESSYKGELCVTHSNERNDSQI